MRRRMTALVALVAALGVAASAYAATGRHHSGTAAAAGSRLDDGKDLLPQATITEQQAVAAARTAASGALGEIDLERTARRLVFNVDVGASDVKVDAANGHVVRVDHD